MHELGRAADRAVVEEKEKARMSGRTSELRGYSRVLGRDRGERSTVMEIDDGSRDHGACSEHTHVGAELESQDRHCSVSRDRETLDRKSNARQSVRRWHMCRVDVPSCHQRARRRQQGGGRQSVFTALVPFRFLPVMLVLACWMPWTGLAGMCRKQE